MKSNQSFRTKVNRVDSEDLLKKAAKLDPIKKSGKDRRALYSTLEEDDDAELLSLRKRDSILDYYDDGEED